jgi:hypothetical protein
MVDTHIRSQNDPHSQTMTRQEKGCGEERITFIFCALESSTYDGYVKLYTATCGAAGLDTLSKPEFYYFTVSMCV